MTLSAPRTTITDSSPAASGSMDDEETSSRRYVHKGKATHRSWPQLPEELIKLIATFYLHNLALTSYCPQTWESQEFWHQRMVYTVLRDGLDLERNVMAVCLGWHRALQNHLIWQQSLALIDPMDYFAAHMFVTQPNPPSSRLGGSAQSQRQQQPIKLTLWKHLRNVLSYSCAVCRINSPPTNMGLGNVHHGTTSRRTVLHTRNLGPISVCREHEKRKTAFCGLCLRENPTFETGSLGALAFGLGIGPGMNGNSQALSQLMMSIACLENEDEDTWPNVEATCKGCRIEWLWRKAYSQPLDREAIGGPVDSPSSFLPVPTLQTLLQNTTDWEIRHTLEGFVDMAEGSINDVLTLAREKFWLRKHTRLGDMMQQAAAARRWVNGGGESATDPSRHRDSDSQTGSRSGRPAERQLLPRPPPQHREVNIMDEVDVVRDSDYELDDEERRRERAQLAMDLELAVQLEREEREREDGEYIQQPQVTPQRLERHREENVLSQRRRARTPSPPALRSQEGYEAPLTIQFAPDAYSNLERFDDRDDLLSQTLSQEQDDLSEEEEEEEEEEDASVLQTEESGVRELALGDWTRARILDGYWISPADVWYGQDKVYKGSGLGMDQKYPDAIVVDDVDGERRVDKDKDPRKEGWTLAVHPCPWTIEKEGASEVGEQQQRRRRGTDASSDHEHEVGEEGDEERTEDEESHPRWETVVSLGPPTYSLCEQAYNAHQKQIRLILLPAMRNIVRKLVMECGAAAFPDEDENTESERGRRSVSSLSSTSASTSRKRRRAKGLAGEGTKVGGLKDPAIIASRMSIDDVVKVLREEEGVWFEGVDWVEKRRNEKEAESVAAAAAKRKRNVSRTVVRRTSVDGPGVVVSDVVDEALDNENAAATVSPPKKKRRKTKDGEDAFVGNSDTTIPSSTSTSTSSTASEGVEEDIISSGSGTSPVLSTTTLQTTPSPPPSTSTAEDGSEPVEMKDASKSHEIQDEDDDDDMEAVHEEEEQRIRILVAPVLERPRLLRPIPHVPLTLAGMAHYTLQPLRNAWREACAPLYQCRCRICERSAMALAAATSARQSTGSADYREPQQEEDRRTRPQRPQERQQTVPPQSPRKDERQRTGEDKDYRIPSIKLRPVTNFNSDLPRREEEEEEESTLGDQDEEEYDSGEDEFERLVDEQDLYLEEDEYEDDQYEQVGYPYLDGHGGTPGEDDVVEIDVEGVDLDLGGTATAKLTTPTTTSPRAVPVTPTRSARKRSCDEQELELDHAGRTVSTSVPSSEGPIGAGANDLGKYTTRAPTPPKRQKTASSVELETMQG